VRLATALASAIALAAGGLAAPAHAAPITIPLPAAPDAIAYSSGRVLWAVVPDGGPIVVEQATATGGAPTVLARIPLPDPKDEAPLVSLVANASGYLVALLEDEDDLVVRGGYDGSLQTLLSCTPAHNQFALTAAAGTSGFAFAAPDCGPATALATVAADGTVSPIPGVTPDGAAQLAYTEPYLAVSLADPAGTVRVLNLADGTRRDLPRPFSDSGSSLALGADGTLVVGPGADGDRPETAPPGVYRWPLGASRPALETANAYPLATVLVSGGRILFNPKLPVGGQAALALTGLGAGPLTPVGAPGAGQPRFELAFEGTAVAFRSFGCDGADQVTIVDVTEPRAAGAQDGCPVTLSRTDPGPEFIGVKCPNGCRADLRLDRIASGGFRCKRVCPTLAQVALRLHPSPDPQWVTLRFTHAGRVARRHHLRLGVAARLTTRFNGPELVDSATRPLQLRLGLHKTPPPPPIPVEG
jgi:hypothetical protein